MLRNFNLVGPANVFEEFPVQLLLYHRAVLASFREYPDPDIIQTELAGALERRIRYAELR